jgi:hypothetical protein
MFGISSRRAISPRIVFALAPILLLIGASPSSAEAPRYLTNAERLQPLAPPPHLPRALFEKLRGRPALLRQLTTPRLVSRSPKRSLPPAASPWRQLAHQPPFNPGAMLQLTDGTVMVQDQGQDNNGAGGWWRLRPASGGSYVNGTWSRLASLPPGYAPQYYASAILPDGRVIIEGGEYNMGQLVETNRGAIYDPVADHWTSVAPPSGSGWSVIGDAPGAVLANGVFMLGASGFFGNKAQALLNPTHLTWTATGSGKADGNGEEGWTLLPNGDLLTVDAENPGKPMNSEIYRPSSCSWSTGGSTIVPLVDYSTGMEIGPQVLSPEGWVIVFGATGHNALYRIAAGQWAKAPDFPVILGRKYSVNDGPGAPLPSGQVLVAASAGVYEGPTHFFLFNGTTLARIADNYNAADLASNYVFMMVLPTGEILVNSRLGDVEVYDGAGNPQSAWLPTVSAVPGVLAPGKTYRLSGTQLNGRSQGAMYGDDYQSATNYPLVRITNASSGHVFYARTFDFGSMSVTPGLRSSVQFQVPSTIEKGVGTLVVVAGGIASRPVKVTITAPEAPRGAGPPVESLSR